MNDISKKSTECPICGENNNCGTQSCWCNNELFPSRIFNLLPVDKLRKSCICKECLVTFKKKSK
ncbi:cysteine-rich CWC family protein [Halalkalibacter lacteus]|uniref:cysteine-rich CWC family protein n=1 Tax=Halalkalibacter lacteus TaxID=3090663 RepID=UPI002FCAC18D